MFLESDSSARRQVQPRNTGKQYTGVWRSLARIWNEEGFKGFMRGNGINCVRIIPYSAVQFTTYEQLKKVCCSKSELSRVITFSAVVHIKWEETVGYPHPISQWCPCRHYFCLFVPFDMLRMPGDVFNEIFWAGTTYPLDLIRSRLSIATASIMNTNMSATSSTPPPSSTGTSKSSQLRLASALHTSARPLPSELTMWGMTLKVLREEGGARALYRGLVATAMGVAPYVGINFAAYEALRGLLTPPGKSSVARKLSCGALAGKRSDTCVMSKKC